MIPSSVRNERILCARRVSSATPIGSRNGTRRLTDTPFVTAISGLAAFLRKRYGCHPSVSTSRKAEAKPAPGASEGLLKQWNNIGRKLIAIDRRGLTPSQAHDPAGEATTSCIDARYRWARNTLAGNLQQCILCRGSCTLGSHCRRRCLGRKSGETTLGLRPGPCIAVPTVPRHSGALQQRRRRACQEWHEDPNSTEYLRPRLRLGSLGTLRIQNFVTCDK